MMTVAPRLSEPQEFREGNNQRAGVDRLVFKEEVALDLVGCIGVRVVKRLSPVSPLGPEGCTPLPSCCGRSALSRSQEPLLRSFFSCQKCHVAESSKRAF